MQICCAVNGTEDSSNLIKLQTLVQCTVTDIVIMAIVMNKL